MIPDITNATYMAQDNKKIREYYKPTGKEEEMLRRVYKRKVQMEGGTDYQRASRDWDKWRGLWEAARIPPDEEWQSNHIVPLTPSVVETILAEMIDQAPKSFIMARGSEDKAKANFFRHVFDYSWETSNTDVALHDILKDGLICGTGIGQEYYLKAPRTIQYWDKDAGGNLEIKEKQVYDYDDVLTEPVKLEDFLVDETARGFTGPYSARDCMRRYIMDKDDAVNYFKQPGWDGLAKNLGFIKPGGDTNYYEFYKPPEGIDKENQVECWWYWSKYPDDWLVVVINDVVAYMGPNIYKHKKLPFFRSVDVKRTHSFYGKGEPQILESTQDEKNVMRRMLIDRNHLDIDKMFAVSNRATLNEEDLMARPHGMIEVDDPAMIKAVEYGDVGRSYEVSMKYLDEDGVIATGVDPRLSSMPTGGTATEAAIVKESALKRIRLKLRILERESLVEMARLRMSNILQFYPQPRLEKIAGDKSSMKYQAEVQKLQAQGLLVQPEGGGDPLRKRYRDVRVKDKEIDYDVTGQMIERPIKGYSIIEAKPEMYTPLNEVGYDIKFKAGSTLPVSEALMQTKAAEMYDRLINNQAFDPQKLGDMLLEVNDYEPDDYHVEEVQGEDEQMQSDQRVQQQIELAMEENKQMAQGIAVPATPYASPAHSRMHIEFLKSQQVPPDAKIVQLFSDHVVPEVMAQMQRSGQGGTDAQAVAGQITAGGEAPTNKLTATQSGEGLRRGVSSKAPKPQLSMEDLVPGRITGSNNLPVQA